MKHMDRLTRRRLAAAFICLGFLSTVGDVAAQRPAGTTGAGSWLPVGASTCNVEDQVRVDKRWVVDINDAHRNAAILALENDDAVPLSGKQFEEFAVEVLPPGFHRPDPSQVTTGLKPYLVRAVSWTLKNRMIAVTWCRQDLLVFSGSLGGSEPEKDPFIVFLTTKPRKVVLSYAGAE
jgi:hypothetical protein